MFKTGSPVTGQYFIDRKTDLPLFKYYIDNNQHIMIKAPRRFGKTSIVKHLLENKEEYIFIYIDIRRVSSLKSLANNIIDQAYQLSGIDSFINKAKESLFNLIKLVQKIKIEDIAEITIRYLENKKIDEVEYFLHSLDLVEKIALKRNINVKFAFDEFQDILEITDNKILNKIRSVIQHHQNVTYIFLGSIETIMTKIFASKSSPFFHFAKVLDLPPLDIKEVYEFANEFFAKNDIVCPNLKKALLFFKGHPDYTMQFLQKIYINALAFNQKNILALAAPNKSNIEKFIISYLKKENKTISGKALFTLLENLDDNYLQTENELLKLINGVEKNEIELDDILNISYAQNSYSVFDLLNFILNNNLGSALEILKKYFEHIPQGELIKFYGLLHMQFQKLLLFHYFRKNRYSFAEAAKLADLRYFDQKRIKSQKGNISFNKLLQKYEILLEYESSIKFGGQISFYQMENMIIKIIEA